MSVDAISVQIGEYMKNLEQKISTGNLPSSKKVYVKGEGF